MGPGLRILPLTISEIPTISHCFPFLEVCPFNEVRGSQGLTRLS